MWRSHYATINEMNLKRKGGQFALVRKCQDAIYSFGENSEVRRRTTDCGIGIGCCTNGERHLNCPGITSSRRERRVWGNLAG